MMYHCILHVQSMSLTSATSTVLILCITMFVTKAFNLDCPYITYIITSVIIRVISTAVNISMSARKLFRNLNFEFPSVFSIPCSFLFRIFLWLQYWTAKSCKAFGALSRLELISKVCNEKGKIFVPGLSNSVKLVYLILLSCHQSNSQSKVYCEMHF